MFLYGSQNKEHNFPIALGRLCSKPLRSLRSYVSDQSESSKIISEKERTIPRSDGNVPWITSIVGGIVGFKTVSKQ